MNKVALVFVAATLSSLVVVACGDIEEKPGTTSSGSSSSSATSSSTSSSGSEVGGGAGMGGMGGAGGMGGMATSSSSSSTSGSSSSSSSSSGSGGAGGGNAGLNGCDQATADDLTGMASTTVQFAGLAYSPPCIRVKVGTSVTFEGNFALHPLQGGTVVGGVPTPDPTSPITLTNSGMSATFKLNNAGDVPYYCTAHAITGMKGAIFVEP